MSVVRPLPVVLAPGLACDHRLWERVQASLGSPSRVVNFSKDTTLTAMAERIAAEGPRFVLAGFSMGGMAALLAAAQAPEKVAALVIVDTHADADTAAKRDARSRQIIVAEKGGFGRMVREELKAAYFGDRGAHGDERALVALMAENQGSDQFTAHVRAIMDRPDLAAAAQRVSCPTTVVTGELDALASPEAARRLTGLIKGARLIVLAGCGHLSPLERPEELAAIIDEAAQGAAQIWANA